MRTLFLAALGSVAVCSFVFGADQVIPMDASASSVAFSPTRHSLLVVNRDKQVVVYNLADGKSVKTYESEDGAQTPVLLGASGLFATISATGAVRVREAESGRITADFSLAETSPSRGRLISSADGELFALASMDPESTSTQFIQVLDRDGHLRFRGPAGLGRGAQMAFSPDGSLLVAAGLDTDIRVWDTRTGELKRHITEMKLAMFDVEFSPDGKHLITAGADRIIYVWDPESWQVIRKIEGQPETISKIHFSPDGLRLVTGGMNELSFALPVKVILWDLASGQQLNDWTTEHMVQGLAFSTDGRKVAVADGSKSVTLWSVATD